MYDIGVYIYIYISMKYCIYIYIYICTHISYNICIIYIYIYMLWKQNSEYSSIIINDPYKIRNKFYLMKNKKRNIDRKQ